MRSTNSLPSIQGLLGVVLTTVADIDTWTMLTSTTAGMVAVGYNFVNTVATLRRCLRALDKGDEHDDGDDAEYAMSSTATLKSNRSSVWMAVRWTCNAVAHMASWTVIAVYSYRSRVHGDHSLEEVASLSVMGGRLTARVRACVPCRCYH